VDYGVRSLSSWSERERALGVVIPTRFRCISYSHRNTIPSTRVSYSLYFEAVTKFELVQYNEEKGLESRVPTFALRSLVDEGVDTFEWGREWEKRLRPSDLSTSSCLLSGNDPA